MKKLIFLLCISNVIIIYIGKLTGIELKYILLFVCLPWTCFGISAFYWFRNKHFYRDPKRTVKNPKNTIVSPADGRIIYIREINDGKIISEKLEEKINISNICKQDLQDYRGWIVGIYMSPFDVHYNYSPINGIVNTLDYYRVGVNLPMVDLWEYINFTILRRGINLFSRKFHFENERMILKINNSKIECLLVLIADKFVNKISTFFAESQEVNIGHKISFIERGSQVDLFINKKEINIAVEEGQQVYGCLTEIATY